MNIALCYVFPDLLHSTYLPLAKRFVQTYMDHPPGMTDHEIHVLVNMGDPARMDSYRELFSPMDCQFMLRGNAGKDIGAYQEAAEELRCDLMVCLGAPVHFYRAGWLDRLVDVYLEEGPGLYGCRAFTSPRMHIRTTAFWLPPQLMRSYPYPVSNNNRYEFEHGANSIVNHSLSMGLECYMVTWNACYSSQIWGSTPSGANLILDQWSDKAGENE